MRYQFSLKSIFIATTLVAGAFGCWRISSSLCMFYVIGVLMSLEVFFRVKYGAHYWRKLFPWGDDVWKSLGRLEDLFAFAFFGALFGIMGFQSVASTWISIAIAIGGAICGASLGIAIWFLIFVDRKGDKNK